MTTYLFLLKSSIGNVFAKGSGISELLQGGRESGTLQSLPGSGPHSSTLTWMNIKRVYGVKPYTIGSSRKIYINAGGDAF